jgi:two-component system NtrC family sensor kinase
VDVLHRNPGILKGTVEGPPGLRNKGLRLVDSSRKARTTHPGPGTVEAESYPVSEEPTKSEELQVSAAEAQIRLLARMLDLTAQPFAVVDFESRLLRVNRAFEGLTGYTSEELLRLTVSDLTPERWRATTAEALSRVRATGKSARYEKEYRRKDGTLVPVVLTVDLNRDENELPIGFFAFVTNISERKQVENALRASEERFRRLYDEAPVGYHEIDTEGRIVNINRTECEMLGYPREEIVGRVAWDFVAPEFREEARKVLQEKFQPGYRLAPLERTIITRDGQRRVVAIEERFKRDDQGRIIGILSTVQDITNRKRTEEALKASERRARALFEGIEDAIFVHAEDGRILDANPAASRLLGYSHEELLSMTTNDIDDPEFAAGYEERLKTQLATGHLSCEGRHRTKDGRVVPVDINTSALILDNQRAVLAVIRDITERKALEETRRQFAEAQLRNARDIEAKNRALTESEARYRQLTEGCLDAVVVADGTGRITLFNPAAEKIFGYQAEEILGQPINRVMPTVFGDPGDGRRVADSQPHMPRIVGKTVEVRGRRKNGEEFPLELSLSAVHLAGELQYIGSIRDQTERHRMRAMLAQSEKLASIGLLSAGVAHEINNPLAYVGNNLAVLERDIKGVCEMIALYESAHAALEKAAPDLKAKIDELRDEIDWDYIRDNLDRMLARTRDGIQRVANIVSNLRGLARTSLPKMESAQIADLFETAHEMIRGRLRSRHIELVVEHGAVPRVVCVPSQISQVILNLLINASQAIESAGRPDGGRIRFATRLEGDSVVLAIADNGCGIPPESIPQLFDPFFTTKSVGEGTGLGLSISHGIISGHGGRIEVESRVNEGTEFRVYLPLQSM